MPAINGSNYSTFFRGDGRGPLGPGGVFNTGFMPAIKPREDLTVGKWLKNSIRPNPGQISDAQYQHAVCMSLKFESAGIFPLSSNESDSTYIYILRLPTAVSSISEHEACKKLSENIVVYDLHQKQVVEAKEIIDKDPEINSGFVGVGLCAYEAFASSVPPKNLVCAVRCERRLLHHPNEVYANTGSAASIFDIDNVFGLKIQESFDRQLMPVEIIENPNCALSKEEQAEIVQQYSSLLNRQLTTTPVSFGFGGKILPNPTTLKLQEANLLVKLSEKVKFAVISVPFSRVQIEENLVYLRNILLPHLKKIKAELAKEDADSGSMIRVNFVGILENEVADAIQRNEVALKEKEMTFSTPMSKQSSTRGDALGDSTERRPPPIPTRTNPR